MSRKRDGSYPDDEEFEDEAEFVEEETYPRVAAGFAAGIVLGALVGATVAVLFAPDKGSRTRRRIGRGVRDLRERAEDKIDHVREDAGRELGRQRRKIRGAVSRTSGRARDIIDDVMEASPLSR